MAAATVSPLFARLRIHQIFGANTDVGKTIFATALCLASARLEERVHYLKPVSTGALDDADKSHLGRFSPSTLSHTLYQFNDPVSPHLAARRVATPPPSDLELVRGISSHISSAASSYHAASSSSSSSSPSSVLYLETAGGVHSPTPSGSSTARALRPLRLPTLLVADSELGGISTTLSAYESLSLAGYDVQAILVFPDARRGWGNAEYLRGWAREQRGVGVWSLGGPRGDGESWGHPPSRHDVGRAEDEARMRRYYAGLVEGRSEGRASDEDAGGVVALVRHLQRVHQSRLEELASLAPRTRESCWWPFTQHTLIQSDADVNVIDSAYGDFFASYTHGRRPGHADAAAAAHDASANAAASSSSSSSSSTGPLLEAVLDGSASWWTQCLGHAHPELALAAARAAGRYGHVLFPTGANEPALRLAESLLGRPPPRPGWTADVAAAKHSDDDDAARDDAARDDARRGGLPIAAPEAPGHGWASRVFFSDDGSTGMEVALKMAVASSVLRYGRPSGEARREAPPGTMSSSARGGEWEVLGLKGSYHGDTIGAMDACEGGVFNSAVQWYRGRGKWFEPPVVSLEGGHATVRVPWADEDWRLAAESLARLDGGGEEAELPLLGQEAVVYPSLTAVYSVEDRLASDPLARTYRRLARRWLESSVREQGRRFAALVLEPLVMGAGGMIFVDPLFQRCLVDVVRESEDLFALTDAPLRDGKVPVGADGAVEAAGKGWRGLPVIFDEVFAGLWRLGPSTPSQTLGVSPDVSVLAKILTGGVVPMAVTLASDSIFATFSRSQQKVDALLHGHSYTAHPVGCEVANETLRQIGRMRRGVGEAGRAWGRAQDDWRPTATAGRDGQATSMLPPPPPPPVWSFWGRDALDALSKHARIEASMAMGTVLAVRLRTQGGGYTSNASARLLQRLRHHHHGVVDGGDADVVAGGGFGIHARPLGNVVYLMCSLNTPDEVRRRAERALLSALDAEV